MTITFQTNYDKAVEALLYIISKLGRKANQYYCLKALFEADKYHLNTYGRTVTSDSYIAMKHGTVPSFILDFINHKAYYYESNKSVNIDKHYVLSSTDKQNIDLLSKSDIEALNKGIEKYSNMSFKEIEVENHKEDCWRNTPLNTSIPFEQMIYNDEMLHFLQECYS